MKAIIMAGGEGKRLRPMTCTVPKPMLPLLNRPIIDYTMDLLNKYGIKNVVFAVRYLADKIKNHIGDGSAWNISASYSDPGEKLGTAGSVLAAAGKADERIIVMSGDGITDVDLADVMSRHEKSGADAAIVLKKVAKPTEYGVALVDEAGMIERFIEKPGRNELFSDLANTGIYILEPQALALIPKNKEFDFSKELFPLMMEKGMKLFGCETESYWRDIGDISQYRKAQQDMLCGRCGFKTLAKNYGGVFMEPNVNIAPGAKLIPPCYVGSGVHIAEDVCIEPYSVISNGCSVGRGAELKRSVLFENVKVRGEAELRGAVVCENAYIDERVRLFENSVIGAGTHIGAGVTVLPDVSVWPEKHIEGGLNCRDNIIWGSGARRINIENGRIKGAADYVLTPETAIGIGAAFADCVCSPVETACRADKKSACCADGSSLSEMYKYAVISGMVSRCAEVLSEEPMSRSAFAYTLEQTGCGGIYISSAGGKNVCLTVFDKNGIEASSEEMGKLNREFLFGEKLPSAGARIGIITRTKGQKDAYERCLASETDLETLKANPKTLRISAPDMVIYCISGLLLNSGWRVERAAETGRLMPARNGDTLTVAVDENENLSAAVGFDTIAGEYALTAVILAEAAEKKEINSAALPVTFPEAYCDYVRKAGAEIIFAPENKAKLRREAYSKGLYKRFLYEPEAMILKICVLFSKGELKKRLNALPESFVSEETVGVKEDEIGRILRTVADDEKKTERELIDGIRLKYDTGWVVVRPDFDGTAAFRIVAGSSDTEYAKELCDIYAEKIKDLRKNENSDKGE